MSAYPEIRRKAWETRRDKYGPRGHSGAYSRAPANTGALNLVIRLMNEGLLSEGQVQAATGLDRVEIRRLADTARSGPAGYEAEGDVNHPAPQQGVEAVREKVAEFEAAVGKYRVAADAFYGVFLPVDESAARRAQLSFYEGRVARLSRAFLAALRPSPDSKDGGRTDG